MIRKNLRPLLSVLAVAAVQAGSPALADVKQGVDAWTRGDYAAAIREWEGPAAAGDADAQYNLGQAYRLGRGVPVDLARAEAYYAQAAAKGHVQAADIYGLLLFQDGRHELALPYVQNAARRGDPRSQYLLGIAHFNGDLLERDWRMAYALMSLANGANLPQARGAIAQMDQHIPITIRQSGVSLAVEMKREAEAARAQEMAAVDLAVGGAAIARSPEDENVPPPSAVSATAIPRAIPSATVAPSVVAAQAAVTEAGSADGTDSPQFAGASYTLPAPRPRDEVVQVLALPEPAQPPRTAVVAAPARAPATMPVPVAARVAANGTAAPAASGARGPWKLQLGAFSVRENAERLWASLAGRGELAGKEKLMVPAGRVTKVLAGGFASQSEASSACQALKRSGQDCLVTR